VKLINIQNLNLEIKEFKSVREASKFIGCTTTSLLLHNNYIIKNMYLVKVENEVLSINSKNKKPKKKTNLIPTKIIDIYTKFIYPFRSVSAAAKVINYKIANFAKYNNKILDNKWKIII
jgi:hypothetical protein